MTEEERDRWKSHSTSNLIVLVDECSGSELIERPQDAEKFQLPTRHPLKIIYDALVTVCVE